MSPRNPSKEQAKTTTEIVADLWKWGMLTKYPHATSGKSVASFPFRALCADLHRTSSMTLNNVVLAGELSADGMGEGEAAFKEKFKNHFA